MDSCDGNECKDIIKKANVIQGVIVEKRIPLNNKNTFNSKTKFKSIILRYHL